MWQDPIVAETREIRESYAEEHHHDIDLIFEDLVKRQATSLNTVAGCLYRPNRVALSKEQIEQAISEMLANQDRANRG
jgi:hypothetical protein